MARKTKISWAHSTFNPWIGCEKVSPACTHCYAEMVAKRMGKEAWGKGAPRILTVDDYWRQPVQWNQEAAASGQEWRVFCGSLMDVMEDRRDLDAPRERLYDLIEATPSLTWLLLSKRPENFVRLAPKRWSGRWPDNTVAMATAENQQYLNERLPYLLQVPARRGLSIEPLLGPVVIPETALPCTHCRGRGWYLEEFRSDRGVPCKYCRERAATLGGGPFAPRQMVKFDYLHWVIVGGESGGGARPMHPKWAKDLRDQCAKHGVAFHFKQWGEWLPVSDIGHKLHESLYKPAPKRDPEAARKPKVATGVLGTDGQWRKDYAEGSGAMLMFRAGARRAGRLLDGKLWDEAPKREGVPV